MTVTTQNRINKRLAKSVDSEIKSLVKLFEQQQEAERARKEIAAGKPQRYRLLRKIMRLA